MNADVSITPCVVVKRDRTALLIADLVQDVQTLLLIK